MLNSNSKGGIPTANIGNVQSWLSCQAIPRLHSPRPGEGDNTAQAEFSIFPRRAFEGIQCAAEDLLCRSAEFVDKYGSSDAGLARDEDLRQENTMF